MNTGEHFWIFFIERFFQGFCLTMFFVGQWFAVDFVDWVHFSAQGINHHLIYFILEKASRAASNTFQHDFTGLKKSLVYDFVSGVV